MKEALIKRIEEYLSGGGLFNPEMANHIAVRDLLIECRIALAQPEQKPVAWLQIGVGPLHEGDVIARTTKPKEWNSEWWKFEPLYTTPPQRDSSATPLTWVGLTEQEQGAIMEDLNAHGTNLYPFARAIEAKLKEKNT